MAKAKAKRSKKVTRVTLHMSYDEALHLKTYINHVVGPYNGPRVKFDNIWNALNSVPELDMFYLDQHGLTPDLRVMPENSHVCDADFRIYMKEYDT